MIPVLLIVVPLICGLAGFVIRNGKSARDWSLIASIVTLGVSIAGLAIHSNASALQFEVEWLPALGSSFSVGLDGLGQVLSFLTAISFPIIFIATYRTEYKNAHNFYALMLLSQAGLMGVFLSN